jgi:RNA recognition motif-containing protein
LPEEDGSTLNNILVRNLSNDATEQDIRSIFETYGTIERFKILTDSKTGQPKAFVEMTKDAAAETAIKATNGTAVRGRTVSVNAARPQLHRTSRSKRD